MGCGKKTFTARLESMTYKELWKIEDDEEWEYENNVSPNEEQVWDLKHDNKAV